MNTVSSIIRSFDDFRLIPTTKQDVHVGVDVRMGGSGIDLEISGLEKDVLHHLELKCSEASTHSANLVVLKNIISAVIKYAKNICKQESIDVNFSLGAPSLHDASIAAHFRQEQGKGVYYLPKADNGNGLRFDVLSFMDNIASENKSTLVYTDEGLSAHTKGSDPFTIKALTLNDTVVLADSARAESKAESNLLEEGSHALGLVAGTGVNFGACKNYSTSTDRFGTYTNYEAGHTRQLPIGGDFTGDLSPLDQIALDSGIRKVQTYDSVFCGASIGELFQALNLMLTDDKHKSKQADVLNHLNEFAPNGCRFEISDNKLQVNSAAAINKSSLDQILNEEGKKRNLEIQRLASTGDPLALAITKSQAKRLAATTLHLFRSDFADANTKALTLTGSHLLEGILSVPAARELFINEINQFRSQLNLPEIKILERGRDSMDGMRPVLLSKVALARAVAGK